jgi:hypothetical protein
MNDRGVCRPGRRRTGNDPGSIPYVDPAYKQVEKSS